MQPTRIEVPTVANSVDLSYFETLPIGTRIPVVLKFTSPSASCRVTLDLQVRAGMYSIGPTELHPGLCWSREADCFLSRAGLVEALQELIPYCLHEGSEISGSTELDEVNFSWEAEERGEPAPETGWECAWEIQVPESARFAMPVYHYN